MDLIAFKWIMALCILAVSLASGLVSLRFINRHKRLLQIGDAGANGIFLGASVFHLLPDSVATFKMAGHGHPFWLGLLIAFSSFLCLLLIDKTIFKIIPAQRNFLSALILSITLFIHAFVEGIVIGISTLWKFTVVIFLAVLAHKGFEVFAFVINLHRRIKNNQLILIALLFFVFITPLGIWFGLLGHAFFDPQTNNFLSGCFDAFAAGTFFYIGSMHRHHSEYHLTHDSHHQYNELLALLGGIMLMGLLSIWI